jgi:hypothetical protein
VAVTMIGSSSTGGRVDWETAGTAIENSKAPAKCRARVGFMLFTVCDVRPRTSFNQELDGFVASQAHLLWPVSGWHDMLEEAWCGDRCGGSTGRRANHRFLFPV